MYTKKFVEGGPTQQVTQFQPTFSTDPQGIESLQQEPDIPAMESSPTDYNQSLQYVPTTQYNAPAANPMTAGLGSYLKGLEYKAPVANPTGTVDSTNEYIYDPATQTYGARPVVALGGEDDGNSGSSVEHGESWKSNPIHAYAEGGSTPQGIASLGRGPDTMLVHMTPGEVHGLQRLAMAHGGSLTINPQTGLPEAGILSALLPLALGFALGPAGLGMSSLGAAATVGGVGALATGSLAKGLQYGLGSYGGASLGGGLEAAGAQQAQGLAATDLANATDAATASTGNASADMALKRAQEANIDSLVNQGAANPSPDMTPEAYRDFLTKHPLTIAPPAPEQIQGFQRDAMQQLMQNNQLNPATQQALARGPVGNMFEGVKQLGTKGGMSALGENLGFAGVAGLAAPLIASAMTPARFNPPANKPTQYAHYGDSTNPGYKPPEYDVATGTYKPASYGPVSYYTNPTQYAAEGGTVGYAGGGTPDFYPLTGDARGPGKAPENSSDIYSPGVSLSDMAEARADKMTLAQLERAAEDADTAPEQAAATKRLQLAMAKLRPAKSTYLKAAGGGLMGLNTYAAGGKLLRGPGDGMSDSIPAVIQGANPQRAALADGEFVIPADVVSHLGNGSTEAGSKHLYSMMDRIRKARTGNPKQGKQINPDRFMPA